MASSGESQEPSNRRQAKGKQPQRPKPPERTETYHSRYVQMLLKQDHIPRAHNILAAFFVWLLLAGFLVFPGTFTSIQESIEEREEDEDIDDSEAVTMVLRRVKNLPLLVIAIVCCAIAAIGMVTLAFRHVRNYVWLVNRLLLPGMANSLAGLISTLISVYTQRDGNWSVIAQVTAIVEGAYLGVCAILFIVTERYLLRKVKQNHGTHYEHWFGTSRPSNEQPDESLAEKIDRKRKEPGLEPSSVV